MVDDENIIPEIEQATQHYCDKPENNCEDLPATQLLKIKVIISIIIEKYKFFSRSLEQFFLTVGQNNFGNKIQFLSLYWCFFV